MRLSYAREEKHYRTMLRTEEGNGIVAGYDYPGCIAHEIQTRGGKVQNCSVGSKISLR